jgi:hypothetical protein
MSRDLLVTIIVVANMAGGCAHDAAKQPDRYVADAAAAFRAWIDRLPRCPPAKQAIELASLGKDANPMGGSVRGLLTFSTNPPCSKVGCRDGCCNTCYPPWVVVADARAEAAGRRELAIQKSGADRPLSAVVQQCEMDAVRQQLPRTQVIVSGFVEGDVMIRATMCVIEAPPAPQ